MKPFRLATPYFGRFVPRSIQDGFLQLLEPWLFPDRYGKRHANDNTFFYPEG